MKTIFSLPLEVVAKLLEFYDIKSIARFEIAFPKYANIVLYKNVKSVSIKVLQNCILINNCLVKYQATIDCLKWLKSRPGMAPKRLNFVLSIPIKQTSGNEKVCAEKVMSFIKTWSLETDHLAIDLLDSSLHINELITDLLINSSKSSDLLALNYQRRSVCAFCQSSNCASDPLLLFDQNNRSVNDSKSSLLLQGLTLFPEKIISLKNPKELIVFGTNRATPLTVFWRVFGVISYNIEKLILHTPGGYESNDFWADTERYGLHTWFPNVKECTLIDPNFASNFDKIWIIVNKFLEARHSVVINIHFSKCSKTAPSDYYVVFQKLSSLATVENICFRKSAQEIAFQKTISQNDLITVRLRAISGVLRA